MGQRRAHRAAGVLTAALDALLSVVFAAPCAACGDALEHPTRGPVCGRCWGSIPPVSPDQHAAGDYDGALKFIIHALKYDRLRTLAKPLGSMMRERGGHVLRGADAVVAVPLHPARQRERGFNQADDLARHLGLPVNGALRRVRATSAQATLAAPERRENVRDAFATTAKAAALRGKVVVLVDDVRTTGATLEACAQALRDAGVADVRVLTAARVAAPPP